MFKNKTLNPELNHHSLQGRRSRALAQALPALNRRWNSSSQTNAFTIIEVVLVLAIAGLIFLMVFVALPALQRNQRDARRKQDLSLLKDAFERYKANNKGRIPYRLSDGLIPLQFAVEPNNEFYTYDIPKKDPSGRIYYLRMTQPSGPTRYNMRPQYTETGYVWIFQYGRSKCSVNGDIEQLGGGGYRDSAYSNRYALMIGLESGGVYCIDG
ncbi:MAG: type II secretion system protein [Candidatus Sacchiramonaceae bacterium]|nr:type II secretion system protein [Candidatus Saccharimonadaceae bacterium]